MQTSCSQGTLKQIPRLGNTSRCTLAYHWIKLLDKINVVTPKRDRQIIEHPSFVKLQNSRERLGPRSSAERKLIFDPLVPHFRAQRKKFTHNFPGSYQFINITGSPQKLYILQMTIIIRGVSSKLGLERFK
ncbi:hypothetical protein V8G54_025132 [Vigna mungo]|uniref:Uncharacterized protein n=1 Tax=Vigna mungo TaxID=3915 RepID=A0AAQ3N8M5_VIGMU